jgi:septum formation protein
MKQIILGSQSPRRKELMQLADIPCIVLVADIDETIPSHIAPEDAPIYLSQQKAKAILNTLAPQELSKSIVITSDTIVVCGRQIFGKPKDAMAAKEMLQQLSGTTHQVITGVSIYSDTQHYEHTASVAVTFKPLSETEITYYITNYRPYDKAGAYAIQEWIGAVGITEIKGDYYSVMGLPIQWVYSTLKEQGLLYQCEL